MSRLLLEHTLREIAPGDDLVRRIAYDFADLFEQHQDSIRMIMEADEALSAKQLKSIFNSAALATQGKKVGSGVRGMIKGAKQGLQKGQIAAMDAGNLSKKAGSMMKGTFLATAQNAAKLNKGLDNLVKKYEDAGGKVTAFNNKADKALAKIGEKVRKVKGGDKALATLKKLGEWGKENPGKQAIALGALAALGGFMGAGAIAAAAVPVYKAVTAGAAGDKLTTIMAKAAKGAALGGIAAGIGSLLSDAFSDSVQISKPEIQGDDVVGPSEVKAEISTDDLAQSADQETDSLIKQLSELSEEEYKLKYAQTIADQYKDMNGGMSKEMVQKIADNVRTTGTYPDNFKLQFGGTIVRGNIYLTPDELAKWEQFVNKDDPFAPNGSLGNETTQWLKDNVEGVEEQIAAEQSATETRRAEAKAKYDAMSPEEKQAYDAKAEKAKSAFQQDW